MLEVVIEFLGIEPVLHADAIACAATLVMGEGAEATPAALVSGVKRGEASTANSIVRPKSEDMFR